MSLKCLSRNDKPEILLKKRESVECGQRTSASAKIFTEHIKFYRMVSLELAGGPRTHPPAPMGTMALLVFRYYLKVYRI